MTIKSMSLILQYILGLSRIILGVITDWSLCANLPLKFEVYKPLAHFTVSAWGNGLTSCAVTSSIRAISGANCSSAT